MRPQKAVLLLTVFTVSAFAQSAAGLAGISGAVIDPSGAAVPNAKVVISSEGQGIIRTLSTNDAGLFTAAALTPASGYKVTVTSPGFGQWEAANVELRVGQNLSLDVALKIATGSTTIEVVVGTAPLVEETKTDVSGVVDEKSIRTCRSTDVAWTPSFCCNPRSPTMAPSGC